MAEPETADRWTSTVVLGTGDAAVIRPITPDDAETLRAFHERQSPESRYRRYFSPKVTLSDQELQRFTDVDFVDRAAFVIEEHGEFIGWASYERWQNRTDAEVAFMIDDQHHGKGAATLLLEHLAAVAQHNGIVRFTAQTLADNKAMLTVFSSAGWPLQRRFDSGVIDVDFPIDDTSDYIDSVERREQRADSRAMARLLLPTSIAVIGASEEHGSVGRELWTNTARSASCPVYAVNPNRNEIGGRRTYRSVTDIPGEVGLAVIAVPAERLEQTIDECIDKRVRGAVVLTVTGDSIDADAVISRARRNGLRIVGPASMGIATPRPEIGLGACLADIRGLPTGGVAISMQSGTLGSSLLRLAQSLGVGLSWFVSLGDKRDVSANDLLQFWEDDEATSVIALYTESFGNPRKFARIARRVASTKPIVAVRTGAALIGDGADAVYHQTGVIEVPTVPALLDTARVLASQPLMDGRRVALLSNARSPAVAARATIEAAGLEVVDRSPLLHWDSGDEDYDSAVRVALDDDDSDAVMIIHAPPVQSEIHGPAATIDATTRGARKPVVAVMLGSGDGPLVPGSDVPSFAFPEQAAAVLGRVATYSAWRREAAVAAGEATPERIDPTAASELIADHLGAGTMSPDAIRQLLATYGVSMPPSRLVSTANPDSVVAAAAEIGYPIAIKATHRHAGRSVEAGVALDLAAPDDAAAAVQTMREHLGEDADEVLVQSMLPPGVDLRVRVTVDDRIGPIIAAGLGGAQADAIADVASRLVPISPSTARSLIAGTRAGGVLEGDEVELVTDLISRVGQLASDHLEIAELDLNPVIVGEAGCAVADATIVLREPALPEHAVRRLE